MKQINHKKSRVSSFFRFKEKQEINLSHNFTNKQGKQNSQVRLWFHCAFALITP